MDKTAAPAAPKRTYTVKDQIELDGITYAKGASVELTESQAASAGDAVALAEPAETVQDTATPFVARTKSA